MTRHPDDLPDPERGDESGGERGGVDVEAAWAQIVAHWSDEAAGHPRPRDEQVVQDESLVLDITDVTDASGTTAPRSGPGAEDVADPDDRSTAADPPSARGTGRPFGPADHAGLDDELHDYPTRPTRHRLTPEEVAELAEEGWGADAGGHADDRRPNRDWRRSWNSPGTSHVGGEQARSGDSRSLDDDTEDDGFVPPEPPPLPRGDLVSTMAWAGALGAPLFLLLAALFWRSAPTLLIGAAVAAFIAGFVALVARMPDRSDDEDDGAVV